MFGNGSRHRRPNSFGGAQFDRISLGFWNVIAALDAQRQRLLMVQNTADPDEPGGPSVPSSIDPATLQVHPNALVHTAPALVQASEDDDALCSPSTSALQPMHNATLNGDQARACAPIVAALQEMWATRTNPMSCLADGTCSRPIQERCHACVPLHRHRALQRVCIWARSR